VSNRPSGPAQPLHVSVKTRKRTSLVTSGPVAAATCPQCRPPAEIRQGVECYGFITTRYCSFGLWITGMKISKDSQDLALRPSHVSPGRRWRFCRPLSPGSTAPQAMSRFVRRILAHVAAGQRQAVEKSSRTAAGGGDRTVTAADLVRRQPFWPLAIGSW
jgi:hypothetical protein